MSSRNAIFDALFALTENLPLPPGVAFVSRSRKFAHFDKVPAEQQPALFQTEHTESQVERSNMPPVRKLSANWTVYFRSNPQDPDDWPTTRLNDVLDAFDAALKPPAGTPRQTLGGLVHHCWIDGTIHKVPGDDDGQGLLTVPISILVP